MSDVCLFSIYRTSENDIGLGTTLKNCIGFKSELSVTIWFSYKLLRKLESTFVRKPIPKCCPKHVFQLLYFLIPDLISNGKCLSIMRYINKRLSMVVCFHNNPFPFVKPHKCFSLNLILLKIKNTKHLLHESGILNKFHIHSVERVEKWVRRWAADLFRTVVMKTRLLACRLF
jgi:hypothetical protein